jgi:hypothetical protein
VVRIENWSIVCLEQDLYRAPEVRSPRLSGHTYGHPDYPDGAEITTSIIENVEGKIVTCCSRHYELGEIDPAYKVWIDENITDWDPENPIRIKKRQNER